MKLAATFLLIGTGLVLYSSTLSPYVDQERFNREYSSLGVGDSREYHQLRAELISPKYRLFDHGMSLILAGAVVSLWRRLRWTPDSKAGFVATGLIASGSTAVALVFDLIQGLSRGEFPHWADSIGIPLVGTPIIFALGAAWAAGHLLFLPRAMGAARPIGPGVLRWKNTWLISMSSLTCLLIVFVLVEGQYWFAAPGLIWLYYYVSLVSIRSVNQRV